MISIRVQEADCPTCLLHRREEGTVVTCTSYRADGLELGQPAALKLPPAAVEKDRARLDRFLNEVAIARQVAHPSLCRDCGIGSPSG